MPYSSKVRLKLHDAQRDWKAIHSKTKQHRNSLAYARRLRLKTEVQRIKAETPCVECSLYFHFSQMQFDHVRGVKLCDVSSMTTGGSRSLVGILEEIAKCECVCANCHMFRTWQRRELAAGRVP